MTLEEQIKQTLDNFEDITSENFLKIIVQIQPHFRNNLIIEYLQGKIQKITETENEIQKKELCKSLKPYLDWYLQGL